MKNERGSNIIRLVAGAYLLYLSYSLIKSLMAGEVEQRTWVIIAISAFIVLGIAILGWGLRGVMQMRNNPAEEEEIEADAQVVEDQDALPGDDQQAEAIEAAKADPEETVEVDEGQESPEDTKQDEVQE